jgi:hypothetical protein
VAVACLKTMYGLRKITNNHGIIGPSRDSKLVLSSYRSALLLVDCYSNLSELLSRYIQIRKSLGCFKTSEYGYPWPPASYPGILSHIAKKNVET